MTSMYERWFLQISSFAGKGTMAHDHGFGTSITSMAMAMTMALNMLRSITMAIMAMVGMKEVEAWQRGQRGQQRGKEGTAGNRAGNRVAICGRQKSSISLSLFHARVFSLSLSLDDAAKLKKAANDCVLKIKQMLF